MQSLRGTNSGGNNRAVGVGGDNSRDDGMVGDANGSRNGGGKGGGKGRGGKGRGSKAGVGNGAGGKGRGGKAGVGNGAGGKGGGAGKDAKGQRMNKSSMGGGCETPHQQTRISWFYKAGILLNPVHSFVVMCTTQRKGVE